MLYTEQYKKEDHPIALNIQTMYLRWSKRFVFPSITWRH